MKHSNLLTAVLGVLLCFFISAGAAESWSPREIEKYAFSVNTATYPDADTLLIHERERYIYQKSGCYRVEDECYTKILTEKGRIQNRLLRFPFNSQYSRIKAELIEIIKPDGRHIQIDLNKNSRIAIDSSQMSSNIYDPAHRVLTIRVNGIETGDLLHVKFSSDTFKARIPGCWSLYTLLQSDCPILENIVEIDAPAELPLRSIAIKNPVPGTVKSSQKKLNGRILYRWRAVHVPQVIPEPGAPELSSCVQRLLVSTAENWREISRWYWNLCRPRLDAVTPEMKREVSELTKEKKTPEEKMRAIFFFVAQQIRYMGITPEKEAPGYEPHDVKLTFERRYGVCRDKAALLCAMLELAGIKAYPVLFMAGEPKDQEIPNIYFNHAVVAAELTKGNYTLLDPTYESSAELFPAIEQDMSYLVAHPLGEILRRSPVVAPEHNRCRIISKGVMDSQGMMIDMETELRFSGNNDLYYRGALSRWSNELAGQFFAGRIKRAVPGARLKSYKILPENIRDLSQPLILKFNYSYPVNVPEKHASRLILPRFAGHFGLDEMIFDDVTMLKRKMPLKLGSSLLTEEIFSIELPPGVKVAVLPENTESRVGKKLHWKNGVRLQKNLLVGFRNFRLNALRFTPEEYPQLMEVLQNAELAGNSAVVIKSAFKEIPSGNLQKSFPGANSVIELLDTRIRLTDANNWRSTERIVRRILNYAGVKAHSEYKIVYNPVWERVNVKAAVISPSGKKRSIRKEEMNIMDSPRSLAVSRYPGEKILVISLPGVMPGSVIELEVEKMSRKHSFFQAQIPFDSFNGPILKRVFTIDFPDTMELHVNDKSGCTPRKIQTQQGRTTLRWSDRDLVRIVREPGQPDWCFFARCILIAGNSPAGFGKIYNKALMEKCGKSSEFIQKLLDEQGISKLPTVREKIKAVRDYTEKHILLSGPGIADMPLAALSDPETTLRSGCGSSADRAIVIASMLKALKIPFDFAGCGNAGAVPFNILTLKESVIPDYLLESILVYLPAEQLYLNDTGRFDQLGSVGHERKTGIFLKNGRLFGIVPAPRCNTASRAEFKINCKVDGSAEIAVKEEFFGKEYGKIKKILSLATPEYVRRFFEDRVIDFAPGAQLMQGYEFDFKSAPGVLRYQVKIPKFTVISGNTRTIALPGFPQLKSLISTGLSRRTTPFERKTAHNIRLIYRIRFPQGWQLLSARPGKSEWGDFNSGCYLEKFNADDSELRLSCNLLLPIERLQPYDYDELENLQTVLNDPGRGSFLFQLIQSSGKEKENAED